MQWQTVESSQISEVGYDVETQALGMRFKGGPRSSASEYRYSNVTADIYKALIEAESVGKYFTMAIESHPEKFPYEKMAGIPSATAEILEPADSALAKIDVIAISDIFKPGFMDPILEAIRTEVLAQAAKLDISTEPNRKAIASLAYKVAKSKTFVDQQRKTFVASEKKRIQTIDAEGGRIWNILEGIQREVRQPLTDWENVEKDRVKKHEDAVASIWAMKPHLYESIGALMTAIALLQLTDVVAFDEFAAPARVAKAETLTILCAELASREAVEADRKELERLKAEAAVRARQDAIEAAAQGAREQADLQRKVAEDRAVLAEKAAEDAKAQSVSMATHAVEVERERIAAEEKSAQDAAEARAKNVKHRDEVNEKAVNALVGWAKLDIESAQAVVFYIEKGAIPNVSITY